MAKHTPGPWEIKDIGGLEVLKEVGPKGRLIFSLAEQPGLGADADRFRAMIVTAPEMLAALKQAERTLVAINGEPPLLRPPADAERRPVLHQAWRDIETIRAAISKAEAA